MTRPLQKNEVDYVFYHLGLVVDTVFLKKVSEYASYTDQKEKILFQPIHSGAKIVIRQNIPILFGSDATEIYSIDMHGNLIFHHDLIKSAFYLLSGYHEVFENTERDHWDRVTFHGSIQQKLDIIDKPIVNEYFELIYSGVNFFLKYHNKPPIKKRRLFDAYGLLLSHDIDLVDKYGWPHLGYKLKELFGLVKSNHSISKTFKSTLVSTFQFFNPKRANPYWNFDYLINLERKFGIKASYYFLAKASDGGSSYSFDEPRMLALFNKLKTERHEIGIHGTTQTANSLKRLQLEIRELEQSAQIKVVGGRQHRLWLNYPHTFWNHEKAGLKYDTSYGFAEREGFRNSFCFPFKPYDFEKDKMIDIWVFPLMAMDVTFFGYRKLSNEEIFNRITHLSNQAKKHNGIFTLLWHNSFFDEILYPEITMLYEKILRELTSQASQSITGKYLVDQLEFKNEPI